ALVSRALPSVFPTAVGGARGRRRARRGAGGGRGGAAGGGGAPCDRGRGGAGWPACGALLLGVRRGRGLGGVRPRCPALRLRRVRHAARGRATIVVAENEPQDTRLVRPESEGGYGLDALWNDDFHHSAIVALTGRSEAYYSDTRGDPQEFVSAAKYGYLFQGQH